MSSTLHLHPEAPVESSGVIEWRARIEGAGDAPPHIWFRTPEQHHEHLAHAGDAFVIATLFHAMRKGLDLRLHAPVSPGLLRNLDEFQYAWSQWKPHVYRRIAIEADGETREDFQGLDRVLTAFSRGLDSCFTAWRHAGPEPDCARRNLDSAVMVHGLDIRLNEPEVFQRAAAMNREMLASLGIELITVATNFRELNDDWDDAHGAAVACSLHAMGRRHSAGLLPGTHAYEALRFPFGSNPLTDPMMASDAFAIHYDGAGFGRSARAKAVAHWPEAMRLMRVCWAGAHRDRNCGACIKCVSTCMCFAAQRLPFPSSIPVGDLATAIRGLMHEPLNPFGLLRMRERLAIARANGIDEPWLALGEHWARREARTQRNQWIRDTLFRHLRAMMGR